MKFDWGEEEENSFQKLKEAITEAPLLVFLNRIMLVREDMMPLDLMIWREPKQVRGQIKMLGVGKERVISVVLLGK